MRSFLILAVLGMVGCNGNMADELRTSQQTVTEQVKALADKDAEIKRLSDVIATGMGIEDGPWQIKVLNWDAGTKKWKPGSEYAAGVVDDDEVNDSLEDHYWQEVFSNGTEFMNGTTGWDVSVSVEGTGPDCKAASNCSTFYVTTFKNIGKGHKKSKESYCTDGGCVKAKTYHGVGWYSIADNADPDTVVGYLHITGNAAAWTDEFYYAKTKSFSWPKNNGDGTKVSWRVLPNFDGSGNWAPPDKNDLGPLIGIEGILPDGYPQPGTSAVPAPAAQ